jgi:hypothetical protein
MSTTKKILYAAVILSAIGFCVYLFADSFKPETIQIFHRTATGRPMRKRAGKPQDSGPVIVFGFDRKVKLTDVKVVAVDALATNAAALPVWHLVTESNSVPLKMIFYGGGIQGMQPFVKGAHALPLETNVNYRLFIKAGKQVGQHDFKIAGPNPPPAAK